LGIGFKKMGEWIMCQFLRENLFLTIRRMKKYGRFLIFCLFPIFNTIYKYDGRSKK
jgi:hypothetical protein